MIIRPEAPADAEPIAWTVESAFRIAEHASGQEAAIVGRLRSAGALAVSLVAQDQGRILGHIAFSPVAVSDGAQGWFGLGPLAVLPERQNGGVGAALVERGLAELRALGAAGCVVLGDPAYYQRFGFRPVPGLILPDAPAPYFQALSLGAERPPRGLVTYAAAFDAA
jgi:putative acetyltransferase